MNLSIADLKKLIEDLPDDMPIKIRALGGEERNPIDPEVTSGDEPHFVM